MAAVAEKPEIREQVGVALNSSRLVSRPEGGETALDRIGALGMAAALVATGQDRHDDPLVSSVMDQSPIDARNVIEGELAPILWHLRYAQQYDSLPRAIHLFSSWMNIGDRMADKAPQLRAFAARILHEWLSDRCVNCGGSGRMQRLGNGQVVKTRGSMARNTVFVGCGKCHGRGKAVYSHVERAHSLGLSLKDFDGANWSKSFNLAGAWIDNIARRIRRPLTAELGRRKRHAQRT